MREGTTATIKQNSNGRHVMEGHFACQEFSPDSLISVQSASRMVCVGQTLQALHIGLTTALTASWMHPRLSCRIPWEPTFPCGSRKSRDSPGIPGCCATAVVNTAPLSVGAGESTIALRVNPTFPRAIAAELLASRGTIFRSCIESPEASGFRLITGKSTLRRHNDRGA